MEDPLWNADHTMTYFSMAYLNREKTAGTETMPAQLFLFVSRIDPETGEQVSVIRQREDIEIPVHGVIAEKDGTAAVLMTHRRSNPRIVLTIACIVCFTMLTVAHIAVIIGSQKNRRIRLFTR